MMIVDTMCAMIEATRLTFISLRQKWDGFTLILEIYFLFYFLLFFLRKKGHIDCMGTCFSNL